MNEKYFVFVQKLIEILLDRKLKILTITMIKTNYNEKITIMRNITKR